MTKLLSWLRHKYAKIHKKVHNKIHKVTYNKITRDVHILIDQIAEQWTEQGEYYRNESRQRICDMLYDYGNIIHQTWDNNASDLQQECCEIFINHMLEHFSDPFIRYDLDFYEHYMTFLEIYHTFNPILIRLESNKNVIAAKNQSLQKS